MLTALIFLTVLVCTLVLIGTIILIVAGLNSPFSLTKKISYSSIDCRFDTDHKLNLEKFRIDRSLPVLKDNTQTVMQQMLRDFVNHLDIIGVEHWVVRSTMLAAVRHQCLMPWHEKISFAIDHNNLPKLIHLCDSLDSGKYILRSSSDGYHFCINNFSRFPYINIFIASVVNNEVVCCTPLSEIGQCTYMDAHKRRREIYHVSEVFPLRETKLLDVVVKVPKNAEMCLDTLYGQDWKDKIIKKSTMSFFFNSYTDAVMRRLMGT